MASVSEYKGLIVNNTFKLSPLWIALIALIGLLVYLYLPSAPQERGRGFGAGATPVVVQTVAMQTLPVTIQSLGTARARESVTLTARQADVVDKILVDDGEQVKKGQLLLLQNQRQERAQVTTLKINLQEAKRQLTRLSDLAKENATSAQLLDEQQANVDALKAQLDSAQSRMEDKAIRAPFDGVLGFRQVSEGALLRPGDVITTLDDVSEIKLEFAVAETHLPDLAPGQRLVATSVAYPGKGFQGTISSVSSRVDPVTRSAQVRALIPNRDGYIRPGMLMKVTLEKAAIEAMMISEAALMPINDQQFVYVLGDDNRVSRREVSLGLRRAGQAQIVSGLKAGEKVVVEGTLKLRDGASVKLLEAS